MNVHLAHQGDYLQEILLVIQESLVNISRTGCMAYSRENKGIFYELNGEGTIREGIGKHD